MSEGSPTAVASWPAKGTMLGPRMAPIVAPQTTVPIADARRDSGRHVRRGVARQQVGGVREAHQERAHEEHQERAR